MKKITLLLAIMCMSAMVFAQTRNLKDADRALKNENLDKALESIKLAMTEPENQALPEAWFSQAKIYTEILTTKEPDFANLEKNPKLAFESFTKAFEMDQSGKLKVLGINDINKLINAAYDFGAKYYAEQKFAEAADAFLIGVNCGKFKDLVDTMGIFNVALCADLSKNKAMAKEYYLKIVELKADQPSAYTSLAAIFREEKDMTNAAKYADMAVELFPDNYNALINAAGIHLMTENSARAQEILNRLMETQADNKLVFFALGMAYDQMKNEAETEKAYLRAVELDADYFDAIFNLGAFYVAQGIQIQTKAGDLPLSETKKYDAMMEQSSEIFKKAVPMLEKALSLQPNDVPVMSTLKDLYVHLKMMDKAKEMTTAIEKLGAK
jgi:tetratricopeptide (TPR) repeat protein